MRGFGLAFDDVDSFKSSDRVVLNGISMARQIKVSKPGNWTRWLDSYTNVTDRPVTLTSSFGGTLGLNLPARPGVTNSQSQVVDTSSGDATIGTDDAWVEMATSPRTGPSPKGPSATVLGTPAPFPGAFSGTANHERDPFGPTLPTTGLVANFYSFKNTLTLSPGQTKSLLHFAVAGTPETTATAGQQIAVVRTTASELAAAPDLSDIPTGTACTIANFDIATTPGFDPATCATAQAPEAPAQQPKSLPTTVSPYPVVGKSLTELQADMEAGRTTSQQITRAYLDRIAAYDTGPFGFHSYISVAKDAMAQAATADRERAAGRTGDLLGIPVALKDIFDTKDQPTTDGSLAFEGFQPQKDAFQVAGLRRAGAVILGKANLSEFANSGSYSESGYMMTANAFSPSKSPLGSSGGPAVATALSLAAFGMGTQTGVSLYAPATGAGLVSMRGTDGISSGSGVMPLTYLQDFEGPMARTTSDIARILNATTGTDPSDPATVHADADAKRPADFKAALDPNALQGKTIGYIKGSFDGTPPGRALSYGQDDGTPAAMLAKLDELRAAGATVKEITTSQPATTPTPPLSGSRTEEGWQHYFDQQINPPYRTASEILSSPKVLPYNRRTVAPAPRLTADDVQKILDARDASKASYAQYMDDQGVDAMVFPGFRSNVYDNDGAQTLSSDRGSDVPTSSFGLPTVILPVGANPDGDPMSLQLVGRAFEDAKILGFGYALEQQLGGRGRLLSPQAPPLAYDPTATPAPIEIAPPIAPTTTSPAAPPEETSPPVAPGAVPVATAVVSPAGTLGRVLPRKLSARTTPGTDRKGPYRFVTQGTLLLPKGFTRASSCKGPVTVRIKAGTRTLSLRRVFVRKDCTFSSTVRFTEKQRFSGRRKLAVQVRYGGNARLLPRSASTRTVRVG